MSDVPQPFQIVDVKVLRQQRDELLAACKVALEYLAPVCISSQAVPNMLRAAIAKAEGERR